MHFVDHFNQGADGNVIDDRVRLLEAQMLRNGAPTMTCHNVRMRLVKDVGVRHLGPHPAQEFQV